MVRNWRRQLLAIEEELSSKDREVEDIFPLPIMSFTYNKKKASHSVSSSAKRRLEALVALYARRSLEEEKEEDTAKIITKFDASTVLEKDCIDTYLDQVLRGNDGMHMTDIIDKLSELGWVSKSKYHVYSSIYSFINRNFYMYEKVGKATFRLRQGIERKPIEKPIVEKIEEEVKAIPTTRDIVSATIKTCKKLIDITPINVWLAMSSAGANISYSAVRKATNDICSSSKKTKNTKRRSTRKNKRNRKSS